MKTIKTRVAAAAFGIAVLIVSMFAGCQKNKFAINNTTENTDQRIFYVSALTGSDDNNGLSQDKAFKTVPKGLAYPQAGDILYIMNGTYNLNSTLNFPRSGSPGKFITVAALPGNKPKIVFTGAIFNAVSINVSYIKVEGIEFQGNNANLTLTAATAAYNTAVSSGTVDATYNMNGISIGGPNTQTKYPVHVEIRNCLIHDFPAGGLSSIQADYNTFEGNTIYNNAWYTMYAPSGVSILTPFDSDNNTGYKNIVRNNTCYNNRTMVPWINTKALSDGNGIIIDINTHPYGTPIGTLPSYNGRTLVENNISYNNGGSGIHAFDAGHVDIINNTAYANGQVVGYADIYAGYANDVKIMGNIMYSRVGGKSNSNRFNNAGVIYDYNIYFNGTTDILGAHDKVADPQFMAVSTNPAVANFQLQSSSPAVNGASPTLFSSKDILNVARPKGSAADCGAYESF